jgi:hypothetical protein
MTELVNKTDNSTVYIDSGIYDYTISGSATENHYYNRIFSLKGYISSSSSSVKADEINTYPVILSNQSNTDTAKRYAFSFSSNVTGSFQYLKFFIGDGSYSDRCYFGTNANADASIIISDCIFSTEISDVKNYIYI